MLPRFVPVFLLFALIFLSCPAHISAQTADESAEDAEYQLLEFDTGEKFSVHMRALFLEAENGRRILFLPDQKLDSKLYIRTAFDEEGWAYTFMNRNWSAFTQDYPASNSSVFVPDADLLEMTEKTIESVFRSGSGVFARVVYGRGFGAALAMKLRSTTPDAIPAAILVDPWGTRGVNPPFEQNVEELREREAEIEDHLWVEWGLGPQPGELYPDSDLGEEGFRRVFEYYDRNAPEYWATVSTGLASWMQILNPMHIAEWPVLVVRGAHPTPEMDARREAVITWLEENGAYVETLDLGEEGPPGLSNLPMAGRQADAVAEILYEWCKDLPDNPKFVSSPSTP